jgi:dolichyl-phosphate beta-glucosyltransferase
VPTPELSIVLPVYNEAGCLARTFAELIPFLEGLGCSFEVVCADDGSRDASPAILAEHAERDQRIRVVTLPANRGKGAAVRAGMRAATGAKRVFFDADLSTPLAELPGFLGALDSGFDVAIGNRRAPGADIERHQPRLRELLGKGFTILTRLALAPGVHDFTCGFKAFDGDAAERIFERSTLDGWAFDAELVVIAQELSLRLAQLPVRWHHEDDTKVRLGAAVLGSLRELAVIVVRRARGRYRA